MNEFYLLKALSYYPGHIMRQNHVLYGVGSVYEVKQDVLAQVVEFNPPHDNIHI